jgi:serine/threonine protein kinase
MSRICPRCEAPVDEDATVCPQCRFILVGGEETDESAALPDDLLPEGAVLADNYRIVRTIGMGGAGIVYEARQLSLENMPVALKVLHPELHEDETTVNLLKKEVIIARELTHDNIMKVYSLERTGDKHFIVMEYVDGESLQSILDKVGKLSFEKAASYFVRVCEALQYAHDRGIIHLDIKPANILVASSGIVKLCDFGIARMAFGATTTATQRIITGSVGFMPPEQYKGRKFVSLRSDIFALGATMYAALSGEVPIGIIEAEGIPDSIVRAMHRKPEERFDSIAEFREAFLGETGFTPSGEEPAPPPITLTGRAATDEAPAVPREDLSPDTGDQKEEPAPEPPPPPDLPVEPAEPKSAATLSPSAMKVTRDLAAGIPSEGLAGNRLFLGAAGAVIALIVIVIGVFLFRSDRPKTAADGPNATQMTSAGDLSIGVPGKRAPLSTAGLKDADKSVAETVNKSLEDFFALLNWDRRDQAYTFLSDELRSKVTRERFRSKFFSSPRLWKIKVLKIGGSSDGAVIVDLQCRISDAYSGTSRKLPGRIRMVERGKAWKIEEISIGGGAVGKKGPA